MTAKLLQVYRIAKSDNQRQAAAFARQANMRDPFMKWRAAGEYLRFKEKPQASRMRQCDSLVKYTMTTERAVLTRNQIKAEE